VASNPRGVSCKDAAEVDQQALVLVDTDDRDIGTSDKVSAHLPPGKLHRAFSVFLFDSEGALLLQQRATTKYHFAGLWSNTCCGHPGPSDDIVAAAVRRTREELGVECEQLTLVGSMIYKATDKTSGLVEHELDHLLVGRCDSAVIPNADEVMMTSYVSWSTLVAAIQHDPDSYTPWLPVALPIVGRSLSS
jgi:isopentenyl-diphosphate delta-isomerase